MIIKPKIRGFICTTSHPLGCKKNVENQINYVKSKPKTNGAKKVLVIGCSTGYGLASRISAAYSCGASTIGVSFEKEGSGKRTASAGYYNNKAFEEFATKDGLFAKTINGDAFSKEIKDETISLIKQTLCEVDMVIYSLAAPRRTVGDITYSSVLKTTKNEYTNKTIDLMTKKVSNITLEPATQDEIEHTVKVMGGEDWNDWIVALNDAGVLANNAITVAYSYIGPVLTHPMYLNGSIGMAKKHLYETSIKLNQEFKDKNLHAYISVNKALVTQSSAAIPIVPLYISILYKVMKDMDLHEGCIEQMYRLLHEKLFVNTPVVDEKGQIRLDDLEMRDDVQQKVTEIWNVIADENLDDCADIDGYWEDFYQMFGFELDGVDYDKDVEV